MEEKLSATENRVHKELLLLGYFLSIDEKNAVISKILKNELVVLFIIEKRTYYVHIKEAKYITLDVLKLLCSLLTHYKKRRKLNEA